MFPQKSLRVAICLAIVLFACRAVSISKPLSLNLTTSLRSPAWYNGRKQPTPQSRPSGHRRAYQRNL
jgi:hypothetical protein